MCTTKETEREREQSIGPGQPGDPIERCSWDSSPCSPMGVASRQTGQAAPLRSLRSCLLPSVGGAAPPPSLCGYGPVASESSREAGRAVPSEQRRACYQPCSYGRCPCPGKFLPLLPFIYVCFGALSLQPQTLAPYVISLAPPFVCLPIPNHTVQIVSLGSLLYCI